MSVREHPTPPTTGHTRRPDQDVGLRPMAWMFVTGIGLMLLGVLISAVSPITTATWSGETVGFLLLALGMVVSTAIPGMLGVVKHPWAAPLVRVLDLDRRFYHPRLPGVVLMCVGVLAVVFSAYMLLHYPDLLLLISYAGFVIVLGLTLAIVFDRRS